jgi:flagellar basal body-associated protein FliL
MIVIIIIAAFIILLAIAIVRARRMNKEQSRLDMHPSNFKKPKIENVQKFSDPDEE